jgi:hypothetical protein
MNIVHISTDHIEKTWSLLRCYRQGQLAVVVGPSALGYNYATLYLGDINMGTRPSRLGDSQI